MTAFKGTRGALNRSTQKKGPNSPDYFGNLQMDEECIRYLVGQIKSGNQLPKLDVSGWLKESKNGKFISLSLGTPYEKTGTSPSYNQGVAASQPYARPAAPVKKPDDFSDTDIPF